MRNIFIFFIFFIINFNCNKKTDPVFPNSYLITVDIAQAQFQLQKIIDQDTDGIGEYGFFQELYGLGFRDTRTIVKYPFISYPSNLKIHEGIVEYQDHYYIIYLPGEKQIYEGNYLPSLNKNDADLQEQNWICYAWPKENQNYCLICCVLWKSEIYKFHNSNKRYIGLNKKPLPCSALDKIECSGRYLIGKIGISGRSCDGEDWVLTKF
jgi:hypothetical protein